METIGFEQTGWVVTSLALGRILRHLASMSVIKEIGIDLFGLTHFSQALAEPKYEGGVIYWYRYSSIP